MTLLRSLLIGCLALLTSTMAQAAPLVVYSSAPASLAKHLAAGFEKATGTPVALYTSSTGKIMARLAAEASHPHADVVILADWTAGLALAHDGLVLPYHPQSIETKLRANARTQGPFLPIGADVLGLVVNSQMVPADRYPHDWFDLTEPRWRDKLSMPSPLLSGTASDFLLAMTARYGERAWTWLDQLKANGCIWPGTNAASLRPVEMGQRALMVNGVGHTAIKAKLAGNSLDLLMPNSGVLLIPRPILILKSTSQPTLAEHFVDYALSPAGQQMVAQALLLPALASAPPNPAWGNPDELHILPVDWNALATQRAEVLARFKREILDQ